MNQADALFPTTVVGSYPAPDWLVDGEAMRASVVPRVRMPEIWRIADPFLEAAQDDATRLAILDMERAGVDIVTDGEVRRESYGTRFSLELEGVDGENPAEVMGRTGRMTRVPRIVGEIRRRVAVEVRDAQFLRDNTTHRTKITMPGPFTLSRQARNEFYADDEAMAMAFAVAINEELKAIKATGIDVIQLDEPWMQASPVEATDYGVRAVNRALEGVEGPTAIHVCFGYAHLVKDKPSGYTFLPQLADTTATQISIEAAQPTLDLGILRDLADKTIILGVLDLASPAIETAEVVAKRIVDATAFVDPRKIVPAPDCGMKYLSREVAFGKLKALADGAALARQRLS